MKKRFLAFMLACTCVFSLIGCGNTASKDETNKESTTEKDSNTEKESESETKTVDHNAWETLTISIDGAEIKMGDTVSTPKIERHYTIDGQELTDSPQLFQIVDINDETPNNYGWMRDSIRLRNITPNTNTISFYPIAVSNISFYFPTRDTKVSETIMYGYDFALSIETIFAAEKGNAEIPEIILANDIKVGQYLQNGCPELIEAYGEPDEINTSDSKYGNGLEYVYISDDGAKKMKIYTNSSRVVGFLLYQDFHTLDCYNPASENNYYNDNY